MKLFRSRSIIVMPVLLLIAVLLAGCAGTRRSVVVLPTPPTPPAPVWQDAGRAFVLPLLKPRLDADELAIARTMLPGGYIVMGGAVTSATQLRNLVAGVRAINPAGPVRVLIDEEGGRVSRLIPVVGRRLSQRERGERADETAERRFASSNARLLRSFGIDMVLAPVADVLYARGSSVLKDRTYGSDPGLVSRMAVASLRGYADEGFDCVMKHFPGHGSVAGDTHTSGPALEKPMTRLEREDLLPYAAAADSGLPFSIMMSHLLWKEIDPVHPASLSGPAVQMAKSIPGFRGLILTDDLSMAAVTNTIGLKETAVHAVDAGADLLLYTADWPLVFEAWSNLRIRLRDDPGLAGKFRSALDRLRAQQ